MLQRLFLWPVLVLGLLAASRAPADAETAIRCPGKLGSDAAQSGWRSPVRPPQAGAGPWTLFDGRPEDLASLAPDRDTGRSQVFSLEPVGEHWVQCRIGRGPVLEQRLPDTLKRCEVAYMPGRGSAVRFADTMSCR